MTNEELHSNLAEHTAVIEEIIGQHYKVYGDKFQEHKCFWDTLASEESNHARCIRDLCSKKELLVYRTTGCKFLRRECINQGEKNGE